MSLRKKQDCIIPEQLFRTDPVTLVLENVVGLYHPWTFVLNCIRWLRSLKMWKDCIILGLSPKVIGSDYPIIVSCDFGCRECGRIVSSPDLSPKVIQRLSSSYCGLQVVAADDDVADRKIKVR